MELSFTYFKKNGINWTSGKRRRLKVMTNGAQPRLLQKRASTGVQEKEESKNYVMLKWPFIEAQPYRVLETKRNTKSYYATHDGTQQK